jgi:hypothetical protein
MPSELDPNETYLHSTAVDGRTGEPDFPPVSVSKVAEWLVETLGGRKALPPVNFAWPKGSAGADGLETFGALPDSMDPDDLASAGWGVIWHPGTPQEIKDALEPLVTHRQGQAVGLWKEFTLVTNAAGGHESAQEFVLRNGGAPGITQPDKIPFYLLLVGGPELISYDFQFALGVDFGVGRLALPTTADYRRYAEKVLGAEQTVLTAGQKRVGFFGPQGTSATDPTIQSATHLLPGLKKHLDAEKLKSTTWNWATNLHLAAAATKPTLADLLAGPGRVPLLFSASHGIYWPPDEPADHRNTGAIQTQEANFATGKKEPGQYFSGADVAPLGDLGGLIYFAFACYGAGTPRTSHFPYTWEGRFDPSGLSTLTERPFQSSLATALLSHPNGPALAFIGHVERSWLPAFMMGTVPQVRDYGECLLRVLNGRPLGYAMKVLADRYASWATIFALELLGILQQGGLAALNKDSKLRLVMAWLTCIDARNFVLQGDPAVTMRSMG